MLKNLGFSVILRGLILIQIVCWADWVAHCNIDRCLPLISQSRCSLMHVRKKMRTTKIMLNQNWRQELVDDLFMFVLCSRFYKRWFKLQTIQPTLTPLPSCTQKLGWQPQPVNHQQGINLAFLASSPLKKGPTQTLCLCPFSVLFSH